MVGIAVLGVGIAVLRAVMGESRFPFRALAALEGKDPGECGGRGLRRMEMLMRVQTGGNSCWIFRHCFRVFCGPLREVLLSRDLY